MKILLSSSKSALCHFALLLLLVFFSGVARASASHTELRLIPFKLAIDASVGSRNAAVAFAHTREGRSAIELIRYDSNLSITEQCSRLVLLADDYFSRGELNLAVDAVQAIPESNKQGDCYLRSLLMATLYFKQYQFELAVRWFKHSLGEHEQLNSILLKPELEAYTRLMLGFSTILYTGKSKSDDWKASSLKNLSMAEELINTFGLLQLAPELANAKATFYRFQGELSAAEAELVKAIEIKNKLGQESDIAAFQNNLAMLRLGMGKLAEAQTAMRASVQLARKHNDYIALGNQFGNLARTYIHLGDWSTARRYYLRALEVTRGTPVTEGRLIALQELAQLEAHQQDLSASLNYLHKAKELAKRLNNQGELSLIYAKLALSYIASGEIELGHENRRFAGKLERHIRYQKGKLRLKLTFAHMYLLLEDHLAFLQIMQETEPELGAHKAESIEYYYLRMLGFLQFNHKEKYSAQGVEELNNTFYQAYDIVLDVERTLNFHQQGANWMGQVRNLVDGYLNYLMQSKNKQMQAEAYQVLEGYLFSILRRSRAYFVAPEQRKTVEQSKPDRGLATEELNIISGKAGGKDKWAALDSIRERLDMLRVEPRKERQSTLSLGNIQPLIGPDEALLKFVLLGKSSFVFVVYPEKWSVINIELDHSKLRAGSWQHTNIQEAIQSKLPWEEFYSRGIHKLVVVADKQLQSFPFSLLRDTNGDVLDDNFSLVHSYSATDYFLAAKYEYLAVGINIFANPEYREPGYTETKKTSWNQELQPLPWTEREALNIQGVFTNKEVGLFLGADASSSKLMSPALRRAQILHIATHGYFSQASPDIVGLATSYKDDDKYYSPGFVSLSQLFSRHFASKLVVLSGCDTMMGDLKASEGLNSLSRGMLAQGAGSVIGTLWKVADKPTSIFMHYFYQYLKQSGDSAYALQQAKIKLRKSGRYRDPKYWAGFVLTSANRQHEKFQF